MSFFKNDSKEVIIARQTASKSNEIPLVQEMLKEFGLEKMILTLDALHCQAETLSAIIDSKNDYVVQVKGNQKKLLEQLKFNITISPAIGFDKQIELSRNRFETREVSVFNDLYGIDCTKWDSVKEFVKVVRTIHKKGSSKSATVDTSYYVSSKSMSAKSYNIGIRAH